MKKLLSILLTGCLLWSSSCHRDENSDCEDCFEGEVTCYINGEEWKARCESGLFGCTPYNCRYYQTGSKRLELSAGSSKNESGIYIVSKGAISLGTHEIRAIKNSYDIPDSCGWYYTDSTKSRELYILSIDTINRIIEGEFNYTAVGECGKVVEITDGYFKVDYKLE